MTQPLAMLCAVLRLSYKEDIQDLTDRGGPRHI